MDPNTRTHGTTATRSRSVRRRARATAFFVGAALALTASTARSDERCRDLTGPFTSVIVTGPTCASPIGLCTHGILTGDLPSTYDFTFRTLAPVAGDPTTQVYTGTSHVVASRGAEIFGVDHGALHFISPTAATFVTVVEIASGTRRFRETRGTIVASGTLDFVTGHAVGAYVAHLCRAHDDDGGEGDDRGDDGDDGGEGGGD